MNNLLDQNIGINELQFVTAAALAKNDVHKLFDLLMISDLDTNSLGFWVWDLVSNVELYSPNFRTSLQYSGENDFPSVPESWMNAISKKGLNEALGNYNKHIETKGKFKYQQLVTYNKKYKGTLTVMCHGKVVAWSGDKPLLMIGVHLATGGFYQNVVDKFNDVINNDVTFQDMSLFEIGNKTSIHEGVSFEMKHKSLDKWNGKCHMKTNAFLPIHHHSNQDETFEVVKGIIVDLVNKIVLKKGQIYTFNAGIPHSIFCRKEAEIELTGQFI